MRLAVITMCMRFVCIASGTLVDPYEAAVGTQETRHAQQLPTSPPDLFPPLPTKIGLVGADASSLSFAFYEPCTTESCISICWYFKKESDSTWQSYLQTSEQRNQTAGTLMTFETLQPSTQYHVFSKIVSHVEGTEDTASCPPTSNISRDNPVHARTCGDNVPGVQNLMVHMDIEEGPVLSWLPPKSKCTTLLEYRVIKLSNNESTESSGGKFWSNATDMVTWPTKPCVAYPERHCHLLGSTSAHIFHVQVKRTQDGVLSKPVKCRRIFTLGPPGPPRGLEVVGAQAQALELRWRLPLLPGGLPARALISVGAGAAVRNHTVCVRGQALMAFKVTGLRPGTLFNVSVSFLQNGIAGEPASVQGRTAPEGRGAPSSKPITSSTIDELPGTNTLRYENISQNSFDGPRPTEQLHYRSNVTRSRGVSGEERDGARALTDPTPLSTSPPTVRPKTTLNSTDANNQTNKQKLTDKANTSAEPNASCVTGRNRLHKRSEPFNSSWTFIVILGVVLFVLAIGSFLAGFCWGRQAAHSRDFTSRRSVYWGCGAGSGAYDAVARAAGAGRWVRSRLLLPTSFQEYEELNPARRPWGRGPVDNAAILDSNSSRSTGYSECFFRGRLPLLHSSYQLNRAFDPHEYEDVTQPPPYEVLKAENNFDQRGMQPLNPTELLQSQVASDQGPSNSTASRMTKERTF
ncbi:hypothetical protein R5R35_005195 [Gryllus longicercus]|uniref:Fibronectin type-III domain-containing protein n=1 Tax=Gryllus longicercus TaxID=2509291 RepID=A0AAN9VV36_9ORTH